MRALLFLLMLLGLSWSLGSPVLADVKVCPLFCDNAVVQREKPIAVWGTSDPGEVIIVRLDTNTKIVTADKKGAWGVQLDPMKAGGPFELTIKGKNKLVFKNVCVGEVWLCSGQSNMTLTTSFSKDPKEVIEKSNNPQLRLFAVEQNLTPEETKVFEGKWQLADPESVRDFSAIGYYYGKRLQEELHVPVGIICSAYGGTPLKTWLSRKMLEVAPTTVSPSIPPDAVSRREQFEKDVIEWKAKVKEARAHGTEEPERPVLPWTFYADSSAFNAMIYPLIPYTVRGFVWYQGEADAESFPFRWCEVFHCMLKDWRSRWHDTTLPVVYVQLPPYEKRSKKPVDSYWARLREQQLFAKRIPFAYMACTIDVVKGDNLSIHLREKREVADRLSGTALACVYKKPLAYSGPIYDSMEVVDNKAKLHFRFADTGLYGPEPLAGFEIAGASKQFFKANAEIEGNTVVVWSDKVTVPIAVRYAWAANPEVSLMSKNRLPASPFRTDKWTVPTGTNNKHAI
jgi:sialate O-acetylesterase